MQQLKTYKKILEYLRERAESTKVTPCSYEVHILEVFKKLTESGWIVNKAVIKQIIEFCNVEKSDLK